MRTTLRPDDLEQLGAILRRTAEDADRAYPGDAGDRQPVHTVYGGAHLFKRDTAGKLGQVALRFMEQHASTPAALAEVLRFPPIEDLAAPVHERVRQKLEREAVEDFRVDFEDGYGARPDDEEDDSAVRVGVELARGMAEGSIPPFVGIRVKPLSGQLHLRSLRTLDLVLSSLRSESEGGLPPRFFVTLPKVVAPEQVASLATALDLLEDRLGLTPGAVGVELMVETTQALLDATGRCSLPLLVAAGRGRCKAAHFGVYDYTAAYGLTPDQQAMRHPACDVARHLMKIALGGTGVWLSDGATNVVPVEPDVQAAMRLHYADVRHSLANGYYQGWDLHPAHFLTRYAAVYAFFLEGRDAAVARLRHFIQAAARATLAGSVFDDAATGQGLLNFFLRGLACGAITEPEAQETGLTIEELATRSFTRILAGREGPDGGAAQGAGQLPR